MSIWIDKNTKKQYTLLVSTGWTMFVYQLLRAKREREEGGGDAKIDAQQLFNFMILPVGRILIDLAVSITGTLQRCPQNFYICQVRRMLSQEPWKYPSYRGGAHWLKYQSVHICYSFAEKWSRKTRISESFQPLYPVTAWMKKLL